MLKPKPSALDVKSNLLTIKSNLLTIKSNSLTIKLSSSNTLIFNTFISSNSSSIINKNNFKVKDATIKKDNKAAIKDKI